MQKAKNLKSHLRPGGLYRRADLEKHSKSVDRELAELVESQVLVKVRHGVYECPKRSRFGLLPPSPEKMVKTFLKDDNFLLTSPNDFNSLGLGTTQLYNYQLVYNHKRHGRFELGGQIFQFCMKPRYPKKATREFLLVEFVNNLSQLAEDRDSVRANVQAKLPEMSSKRLRSAVKKFSKASTRKFFEEILSAI
ncbi:hypothetical protein [Geotalea toluenoxydans]|uniref:hypothetical protein n=1 Tax=Geotalea toluenoxydans TaxID=421624 RepID=UPI0006D18DF1|nr:hypothetical protein [Geotalea toluenoxydans]